jgi:hypothetical protein
MTISFKTENNVIIFTLEKIIAFARDTQYICVAQSILWIALIIGLQQRLVEHISNVNIRLGSEFKATTELPRREISVVPEALQRIYKPTR